MFSALRGGVVCALLATSHVADRTTALRMLLLLG